MEGNNHPLSLNAWHTFVDAIDAMRDAVRPEENPVFRGNSDLAQFTIYALRGALASQAEANHTQYLSIVDSLTDDEADYVQGSKSPSELVGYLMWHNELESIEISRRTIPGIWNTKQLVDGPVRADLDDARVLGTKKRKSQAAYRIKTFNFTDQLDRTFVMVDRKRVVRQHFGGQVLTIVRNSIIIHDAFEDEKSKLPENIKNFLDQERSAAGDAKKGDYNYNKHHDELVGFLEPIISNTKESSKPAWAIPAQTTYYAAKKDVVTDERLKEIA